MIRPLSLSLPLSFMSFLSTFFLFYTEFFL